MEYNFQAELWKNKGEGGWHFVTIPKDVSDSIYELYKEISPGWGSIPVEVTIGSIVWKTSAFYDTKEIAYLLPIKAEVRRKAKVNIGDIISLSIRVIV